LTNEEKVNHLFEAGRRLFNSGEYFDAHEEWEEMWSEFNLPDRLFVQGLIQVTVSLYHLLTGNLKGSRNLMGRAIDKLTRRGPNGGRWNPSQRGINSTTFIEEIERCAKEINRIDNPADFNWNLVPRLQSAEKNREEEQL
tara:strand:- start:6105 stop:6524 length:420 start_codon:yes stop_codon:yes gene_type:complete